MKASFVPGRMIVNKIKALRFTLAGRDDGMRAFYSRSRRWSRPGRDGCLARFAVAMIGEQICCDAICNVIGLCAQRIFARQPRGGKAYLLQIGKCRGSESSSRLYKQYSWA
jgi:hypothetical protein